MLINKITLCAERIALYSANQRNVDASSLEFVKIKYGLQILLVELTKIIPYGIIFALLGMFPEYLFALIVLAPIRVTGGGYHAKTYGACYIVTFLIFFVGIYLPSFFTIGFELKVALFIVGFLLTLFLAPVPHPNMPIRNEDMRKKRRIRSVVLFILWGIPAIFLNHHFSDIVMFMLFIQAILLPLGLAANKIHAKKVK